MKLPAFLLMLTAGALVAADDAKDAAIKKEKEKLQGRWLIVGAVKEGKESPAEELKKTKTTLTFTGDNLTTHIYRGGTVTVNKAASYSVDPSIKPKSINLIGYPVAGSQSQAIYELDADNLKICIGDDDKPKEFVSSKESKTTILLLRREK